VRLEEAALGVSIKSDLRAPVNKTTTRRRMTWFRELCLHLGLRVWPGALDFGSDSQLRAFRPSASHSDYENSFSTPMRVLIADQDEGMEMTKDVPLFHSPRPRSHTLGWSKMARTLPCNCLHSQSGPQTELHPPTAPVSQFPLRDRFDADCFCRRNLRFAPCPNHGAHTYPRRPQHNP
jgi:hypothetical protein